MKCFVFKMVMFQWQLCKSIHDVFHFDQSRMVGLSPHLILRTRRADAINDKKDDLGWTGNILFDRMVGSTIYTCTPGEVSEDTIFFILIQFFINIEKMYPNVPIFCIQCITNKVRKAGFQQTSRQCL